MSSVIECEIMYAYACLNHSECVRREGVCLKILYVCLHTYSISDAPSAEVCAIKHLYGDDTVCVFVYVSCMCVTAMVWEFACKSCDEDICLCSHVCM